jgi:RNA polymerase sigma-70 factor (ECF subfamily)
MSHIDSLSRTAVRVLGSPQDAEDVVQDTYLRAWKYFDSFETGSNCRAWLFRIMFNVIGVKRKRESRLATAPLDDHEDAGATSNVVFLDPLKRIEGREVLDAAVRLSEEHRSVLWLVVVEEMTYKEVAEALEVPIGTVMSRLHRARRELRKRLTTGRAGGAGA